MPPAGDLLPACDREVRGIVSSWERTAYRAVTRTATSILGGD
jgi:hypothetical protein